MELRTIIQLFDKSIFEWTLTNFSKKIARWLYVNSSKNSITWSILLKSTRNKIGRNRCLVFEKLPLCFSLCRGKTKSSTLILDPSYRGINRSRSTSVNENPCYIFSIDSVETFSVYRRCVYTCVTISMFLFFWFLSRWIEKIFFFVYLRSRSISTFVNNEHVINETIDRRSETSTL